MPEPTLLRAPCAGPSAGTGRPGRVIYIACPWTPVGGGMFKVADYLIQAQAQWPQAPSQPQPQSQSQPQPPSPSQSPSQSQSQSQSQPPSPSQSPSRVRSRPRTQRRSTAGPDRGHASLQPLDTRGAGSAAASMLVLARALATLARGRVDGSVAGVHVNMAERLSLFRKSVVIVACRALGLPVVLHLHAAQLHRTWPRLPAPLRALVRWVFSLPQCCIVLGHEAAGFVTHTLRVPPQRVEIVINGVPEPPVRPVGRPAGPVLQVLFVGNLSDRKGVPELLQAMALPPLAALPLTLTLAGGGDIAGYRAAADRLGLGARVRFEGWAGRERLAVLLSKADALVLPSHDEGLPLAILEALACGVPVVCTPVGEIAHTLIDGRHARFVPPGDGAALARGLAAVLQDPRLRESLARHGQALYREQFAMNRFFDRIGGIHARHFGVAAVRAAHEAADPPAPRDAAQAAGAAAGEGEREGEPVR